MKCEAVGHLMDDLLDNALSLRERELLEEHLGRCPRCLGELRQRPAFERRIRRALSAAVQPLALPSRLSSTLVQDAQKNLRRARWSRLANYAAQAIMSVAALCLLAVGLLFLAGSIPVPSQLQPVTLFTVSQASLSKWVTRVEASLDSRQAAVEDDPVPVATSEVSLIIEPYVLRPKQDYAFTVYLWSAEAQPVGAVALDLDVKGPTGYFHFDLSLQEPLPERGVSVLKVTPELLSGPFREHYLMAPTELFALEGVYDVRVTMTKPVSARRLP